MKCVIVALALLCSAQALKMDRQPQSARARNHVETFNALDREAGRPERYKVGREAFKAAEFTGDQKDISDGITEKLFDWADDNGMQGFLNGCALLHTNSVDIMLCVGDGLVGGTGAGVNDAFCAETDAWNTNAGDIIDTVSAGAISDSESGMASVVAPLKNGYAKRAPFQYGSQITDASNGYLNGYGIINFVQNILNGYSFYCDEVSADAFVELLEENGLGDGSFANTRAALLAAAESKVAGASVIGGTQKFGDYLKVKWNEYANMKLPGYVERMLEQDYETRVTKNQNFQKWRKGQFRRLGRKPQ